MIAIVRLWTGFLPVFGCLVFCQFPMTYLNVAVYKEIIGDR